MFSLTNDVQSTICTIRKPLLLLLLLLFHDPQWYKSYDRTTCFYTPSVTNGMQFTVTNDMQFTICSVRSVNHCFTTFTGRKWVVRVLQCHSRVVSVQGYWTWMVFGMHGFSDYGVATQFGVRTPIDYHHLRPNERKLSTTVKKNLSKFEFDVSTYIHT